MRNCLKLHFFGETIVKFSIFWGEIVKICTVWGINCKNLQFIPKIVQILTIFPKKANLENISQKSTILDNFPFLKVKNMGKFFHYFFAGWGKNRFLWQNTYEGGCAKEL